jgi:DNA-binding response OmpR family regulator
MDNDRIRPRLDARRTTERPHVLIVTDDPTLSEFLAEGLPLGGFWTSVIASGLQALEVFRLRQFDLIVLDMTLQSFDAIEFLKRLRGVSDRASTTASRTGAPAILIYPQAFEERTDARELGISATIYPPLELDEVVRVLHAVFLEWRADHPDSPLADAASLRAS